MIRQTGIQLKKEFFEAWRRKRILVLVIVFVATGLMSPTLAKLTPEIMRAALPAGMALQLPAPSAADAWTQFFKNSLQFGLLAMVLFHADTLCGEVERGTLVNLLTKGMNRTAVVLGKTMYLLSIWTLGFWGSFLVSWGYTGYFFPDSGQLHILTSCLLLWLYGVLFLSLMITASAIAASSMQSLLLMALVLSSSMLLEIFQKIKDYDPFTLGSRNLEWLTGSAKISHSWPAILLALLLILVAIGSANRIFSRRQL